MELPLREGKNVQVVVGAVLLGGVSASGLLVYEVLSVGVRVVNGESLSRVDTGGRRRRNAKNRDVPTWGEA